MKGNSNDTHLVLYETERPAIERWASFASRTDRSLPWSMLVLVVDLRGRFGRSVGLHVFDRVTLDRRIRQAGAMGGFPTISVPIPLAQGEALVEAVAPELLRQIRERPRGTVPILLVDELDAPRIGLAFVRSQGVLN